METEGALTDLGWCRSLGLTLLEAATGRYPYNASGGPLELMLQVTMLLQSGQPALLLPLLLQLPQSLVAFHAITHGMDAI